MPDFSDLIISFYANTVLRVALGSLVQVFALPILLVSPYRREMSRARRLKVYLAAALTALLSFLITLGLEHSPYADYETYGYTAHVIEAIAFRLTLILLFLVFWRQAPRESFHRVLVFVMSLNYRLMVGIGVNFYTSCYSRQSVGTFDNLYRLDILIFAILLHLLTLIPMRIYLCKLYDVIRSIPSRVFRPSFYAIPILAWLALTGYFTLVSLEHPKSLVDLMLVLLSLLLFMFYFALSYTLILNESHRLVLEIQVENMRHSLSSSERRVHKLRELKHDYKSHLSLVQQYLKDGKPWLARRYIVDLIGKSELNAQTFYCRDQVLNALLSYCMLRAEGTQISLVAQVHTACYDPLDQVELTSILSNLVGNALDELMGLPEDAPPEDFRICLEIFERNEYLIIRCTNRLTHEIPEGGPDLIPSSKGEGHGEGLRIVRMIAHARGGRHSSICAEGRFIASLVLPRPRAYKRGAR